MTTTSRRSLLRAGTLGAILATLVPARYAAATTNLYSRSRFRKLKGTTFTLRSTTASWSVTLAGVSDLPGAPSGADNAFGLTFRSARGGPPQGTYTLVRSGFTATTLFVVPSDAARLTLQAVVNRAA